MLKQWLIDTYRPNLQFSNPRPYIICKDGFKISVQASIEHFSEPASNLPDGKYKALEVEISDECSEELLKPYDYWRNLFLLVPIDTVEQIIVRHGGIIGYQPCI